MSEKRRGRRIVYHVEARVEGLETGRQSTRVTDISTEGAFIDSRTVFPVGRRGVVAFAVGDREISVEIEVVHAMSGMGMGVRFVNLGAEERALIETLIKAHSSRDV